MCILHRTGERRMMGEVITSVFNKNNVVPRKKKGTSAQLPTDIPQDPEPVTGKRLSTCSVIRALAATAGILSILYLFSISVFFFSSLALLCTHIARKTWANHIAAPPLHTHDTSRGARSATVSHIDCSSVVRSERVQKVYFDHLAREL